MSTPKSTRIASEKLDALSKHFSKWEKIKDLVDQNIDIMLNYRQSGHPGGSVEEVVAEAHLSQEWLLKGIERFVRERKERLNRIRDRAERALKG